jgi:single-strand DNA-binding protein
MGTINSAFVLGNLGTDPDFKMTSNGHAMCELSIATRRSRTPQGDPIPDTIWHKVKLWRHNAEFARDHLSKGDPVAIEGSIRHEEWTASDGSTQRRSVIHGHRLTLLGRSRQRVEDSNT